MSTQTWEPAVYIDTRELLQSSVFNDKQVKSYIHLPLGDSLGNSPLSEDSAGWSDLPASLHQPHSSHPQTKNNMPFYGTRGFEMSFIDPGIVSAPAVALNCSVPFAYEHPSNLLHQDNRFTNYNRESEDVDQIFSSTISAVNPPTSHPSTTSNNSTNGVKKRKSRKKKAPLSPAAEDEKRKRFLDKNRLAAAKCRDKNRKRWDRVQEQCDVLEVLNQGLRRRCRELAEEMGRLRELATTHGDKGLDEWIEGRKDFLEGPETSFETRSLELSNSQSSSGHAGNETHPSEGHQMHPAFELQPALETTFQNPPSKASSLSLGSSNFTSGDSDGYEDIDMTSFIEDEDIPSPTPSRKPSAASISTASSSSTNRKSHIPSPADSGVDMTSSDKT